MCGGGEQEGREAGPVIGDHLFANRHGALNGGLFDPSGYDADKQVKKRMNAAIRLASTRH